MVLSSDLIFVSYAGFRGFVKQSEYPIVTIVLSMISISCALNVLLLVLRI